MACHEPSKEVIQCCTVHIKPKYYMSYLCCIPKGVELVKKHGGTPIHQYIVEAGGGPEVIFLNKWSSLDGKLAANKAMFSDPDFHAYMKEQAKKVYCVDDKLCMKCPLFETHPASDTAKVCMETLQIKGFPLYAAGKLHEGVEWINKKLGEGKGAQPHGVLIPIAYNDWSMIVVWPSKDNQWDPCLENWFSIVKDPHNWLKLSEGHCYLEHKSAKFLQPFNIDMVPEALRKECA